jgi:hypothetical protein
VGGGPNEVATAPAGGSTVVTVRDGETTTVNFGIFLQDPVVPLPPVAEWLGLCGLGS